MIESIAAVVKKFRYSIALKYHQPLAELLAAEFEIDETTEVFITRKYLNRYLTKLIQDDLESKGYIESEQQS